VRVEHQRKSPWETHSRSAERYDVVISRLNRAGVELVASSDSSLQFGDILNLVGRQAALMRWLLMGNAQQQVQMLPVFIGIGLGVLLGSIPSLFPASRWH
jgi:putative transport protein